MLIVKSILDTMKIAINFIQLFGRIKPVIIGMIHVRALPGAPKYSLSMSQIVDIACKEAHIYKEAGLDAILLENMYDVPWLTSQRLGPETVAAMSVVCSAVRDRIPALPIGVQLLAGCNRQALAVAHATGLNFIRAEGFVFSHVGDEGPMNSCAAELLRYRRHIAAENVMIFTDIKKKHSSHSITSDISLVQTAQAAELFHTDGVIVTGNATGQQTDPQEVKDVQEAIRKPVLVGSGITDGNVYKFMSADALIIGSHFKAEGQWENDINEQRVHKFMDVVLSLRDSGISLQS